MNYLYLILNIGSIIIPLFFSFHPKLKFYKYWKPLFLAMLTTMVFFIAWDVIFTNYGIWGFNEAYFIKYKFLNLPIEEWLFFICIPYACVFTHYALLVYFPKMELSIQQVKRTSYFLIGLLMLLSIMNYDKWYTLVNFLYASIILTIILSLNIRLLQHYYVTFLVMLIPFFVVNGILTGSFIEDQVVWYDNNENLNMRLFTIPIEDTIYAFSLVLTNLALMAYFQKKLFRTN